MIGSLEKNKAGKGVREITPTKGGQRRFKEMRTSKQRPGHLH